MTKKNDKDSKHRVDEFIKDPKKALFTLGLPILAGMVFQTLYNIADTAFVGRLGADSIAAITFAFPIFFVLMSINAGIGTGMSARISRMVGAKDIEGASKTATTGVIISLLVSLLVFTLGTGFIDPLLTLLGATDSVKALTFDYVSVIIGGVFFLFMYGAFQNIFTGEGDMKPMMIILSGSIILNIILDPIFIYLLGYGVKGAAIATVLAWSIGLIAFYITYKKRSLVRIKFRGFEFDYKVFKEIIVVGIPTSIAMVLMSVFMMFINSFMAYFGTDYVAMFGIITRLESAAIMPVVAFSTALVTLMGMFYGAKRTDLLKDSFWYAIKIGMGICFAIGVIFYTIPELLVQIFTHDADLIQLSVPYMRAVIWTFPLMVITMMVARGMQAFGKGLPGLIIQSLRIVLVSVPAAWIFIYILEWPYWTVPIAGVLGGLVSSIIGIIWIRHDFKKMNNKQKN